MCDEHYELYGRCAACCLPGRQLSLASTAWIIFICSACSQRGMNPPVPVSEWNGRQSDDNMAGWNRK